MKIINSAEQPEFLAEELQKKLFSAERRVALVRFLIVALNSIIYHFYLDKSETFAVLAYSIIVIANIYSFYVIFFKPYQRYPILLTGNFTSVSDGLLITLWLVATGGFDSPFYVLWYVSLIAIAIRFSAATVIGNSLLYAIIYLAIIYLDVELTKNIISDVVVRISYLFFTGILCAFLSTTTLEQIKDKIRIKSSEKKLKQSLVKLDEQMTEKEKARLELKKMQEDLEQIVEQRTRELASANQQLNKSNNELKSKNEDLDNFVYATTHDLKNPIVNIEALFDMLIEEENCTEGESAVIADKIKQSIKRLQSTIQTIAEINKVQKDVYGDIQSIDVQAILNEIIEENEEVIKRAHAEIKIDPQVSNISFSKQAFKSILYNLVSNAIKYSSPERKPQIEISFAKKDNFITMAVKDNGLGIDLEKDRDKLFNAFKRIHDHIEGSGIGLYTIQRIIEKNGGKIEVQSELNKGSTFTVYFPERND